MKTAPLVYFLSLSLSLSLSIKSLTLHSEDTALKELIPKYFSSQQQLYGNEETRHHQSQHGVPKKSRKGMTVSFHWFPIRFRIAPHPQDSRIQPQGCKDKGRDGKFQSRKQHSTNISSECFEYLLMGSLDTIERLDVFASPLCTVHVPKIRRNTGRWDRRYEII